MLVGLVLAAAGCSRPPGARRPIAGFVRAEALMKEHPQWREVVALDRQIAFLRGYHVPSPRFAPVAPGRTPYKIREMPPSDVTALNTTIKERMDAVYKRQRDTLRERLGRLGAQTNAAHAVVQREQASSWADGELEKILASRGPVSRNLEARIATLDARIETLDSLAQAYPASKWDHVALDERRAKIADELAGVRAKTNADTVEVFKELTARLAELTKGEAASADKWLREHRQELDNLDREILHQKSLLLDALQGIAVSRSVETSLPVPVAPGDPPRSLGFASESHPAGLASATKSLAGRRNALAVFVLRDTRAIIRSAAARRGVRVAFDRFAGMDDRTEDYRKAVRAAALREKASP